MICHVALTFFSQTVLRISSSTESTPEPAGVIVSVQEPITPCLLVLFPIFHTQQPDYRIC